MKITKGLRNKKNRYIRLWLKENKKGIVEINNQIFKEARRIKRLLDF